MSAARLILIPGMGADERLFGPQSAGGLSFEVARFPIPEPHDDMAAYAARVARTVDLSGPCIIGGVSFGGMVACELARLCNAQSVLLIASCRGSDCIPGYYAPVEWLSRLVPDALIQRRCEASSRMLAQLELLTDEQYQLIRDMSLNVPVIFLRRVAKMILKWRGARSMPCPVFQIHGGKDRIIPPQRVQPDEVIPEGGHLINLKHAEQVNSFIARHACVTQDTQEEIHDTRRVACVPMSRVI